METRIGFGRRLGAFVIDVVISSGLAFIVVSIWGSLFENFVDWSKFSDEVIGQMSTIYGGFTETIIYMGVAGTLVSFLYFIIEGFTGYTIGKLMLGIQVGTQEGKPADQSKLMVRFAIKNISTIVGLISTATMISVIGTIGSVLGFIVLIGCFFVLGESKLAFHDMLAKTAVYRKVELEDGTAAQENPMI